MYRAGYARALRTLERYLWELHIIKRLILIVACAIEVGVCAINVPWELAHLNKNSGYAYGWTAQKSSPRVFLVGGRLLDPPLNTTPQPSIGLKVLERFFAPKYSLSSSQQHGHSPRARPRRARPRRDAQTLRVVLNSVENHEHAEHVDDEGSENESGDSKECVAWGTRATIVRVSHDMARSPMRDATRPEPLALGQRPPLARFLLARFGARPARRDTTPLALARRPPYALPHAPALVRHSHALVRPQRRRPARPRSLVRSRSRPPLPARRSTDLRRLPSPSSYAPASSPPASSLPPPRMDAWSSEKILATGISWRRQLAIPPGKRKPDG
ncbi:hypothetical protein B0H16DRAFT_1899157 [Mycena metata]|uniref:Uncharacterized protein n=1 Tax=Mycena metata TaxID=1033252 RepID=A0AAD7H7F6_9AGAR|nr:hypothetical protein B0H16DRAFT_1899157 [Mycena metata]